MSKEIQDSESFKPEALNRLNDTEKKQVKSELKELTRILWDGEIVEDAIAGTVHNGRGLAVATNQRIIFLDKKLLGLTMEDFNYDKVSSVKYNTGLIFGTVIVLGSGNKLEITSVLKESARGFGDFLRAKINKREAQTPATNGNSKIEQLERLALLKDKGVLSEQEFEAEKAKVLD